MRLLSVCGPPSSGKTAVLLKTIPHLRERLGPIGVVKWDCLATDDDQLYARADIPVLKALSGPLCPDHYFVSNLQEAVDWAGRQHVDVLVSESAGLCNRCSPYLKGVCAICVIDNLSGLSAPKKIGPMLRMADIVVVTKGDVVSQAEREVFACRISAVNPTASVLHVNGLSGQGAFELSRLIFEDAHDLGAVDGQKLRFPMPSALCSYCLGETRVGVDYQVGNLRKLQAPSGPLEGKL